MCNRILVPRIAATRTLAALFLAGGPLATWDPLEAAAPNANQTRDYQVLVDKKPAGTHRLAITGDDEHTIVDASADVRVRYLVYNYVYKFKSREIWRDGRLQNVDSAVVENGKSHRLGMEARNGSTDVRLDGTTRSGGPVEIATTFWKLPSTAKQGRPIAIIDSDSGKQFQAVFRPQGVETLRLGTGLVRCDHYRLDSNPSIDLWFDVEDRLVRQISLEDGHLTEIRLQSIFRETQR